MKKLFMPILLLTFSMITLNAENNSTIREEAKKSENNSSIKDKRAQKQLEEQMKREEKYAKEKTFYKGKNFDLSHMEVDPSALDSIPDIEPDYDFDMDDVYD